MRLACCDCGLVHNIVLVSHDRKKIGVAMERNKRSTAQRRRWLTPPCERGRHMSEKDDVVERRYRYAVFQNGMKVADVDSPDEGRGIGEIMHYAAQYSQDGPIELRRLERGRWMNWTSFYAALQETQI